jgi:hypothetical protein
MTPPKGSLIDAPPSYPATPDLIDVDRLWRTTGDMSSAIAWTKLHVSTQWRMTANGQSGGPAGVELTFVGFALPSSRFESSQVYFSIAPDGRDHVAVRMDVQVVWTPTRPEWSYVASNATRATVTLWPSSGSSPPRTTSSTDPATVASLRRLVNAMTISTVGVTHCPAELGQRFSLRFSGSGSPDVEVSGLTGECGGIRLGVHGHPGLEMSDSGGRVVNAVKALALSTS